MSGYKAGYSEKHSPTYDLGMLDGAADAERVGQCPPIPPVGPILDGAMYRRGYESVPQVTHQCTEKCQK